MYYLYYNTFNFAALNQTNRQSANNVAIGSLFTTQAAVQNAGNSAQIVQG